MKIFENLQTAIKAAIEAKNAYKERLAKNDSEWEQFSNYIKDAWGSLDLQPNSFKVGATQVLCSNGGIEFKGSESEKTPRALYELTNRVIEYLEAVRENYDSKFVEG